MESVDILLNKYNCIKIFQHYICVCHKLSPVSHTINIINVCAAFLKLNQSFIIVGCAMK